jgi:hypothetical protein
VPKRTAPAGLAVPAPVRRQPPQLAERDAQGVEEREDVRRHRRRTGVRGAQIENATPPSRITAASTTWNSARLPSSSATRSPGRIPVAAIAEAQRLTGLYLPNVRFVTVASAASCSGRDRTTGA